MTGLDNQKPSPQLTLSGDAEAIRHLEQTIKSGQHWYIALLEAIAFWTSTEETHNGRTYRYLIDGEAFDWLLLAERLCEAVDGLIPDDERADLLFQGESPLNMPTDKFKELISSSKYRQYLNYFYGIIVEEALILTVRKEVRKEQQISVYNKEHDYDNEVFRRIYGATKAILLKRFRQEKDYPKLKSISLTELKEFTYWLFKYRLEQCDKARVASDTKKALEQLAANGFPKWLVADDSVL